MEEREYFLDELFSADEVMISSAGSLCIAASELDGVKIGGGAPEILKSIQNEVKREFLEATSL